MHRRRPLGSLISLAVVLSAIGGMSCVGDYTPENIRWGNTPTEEILRIRVEAFYTAEAKGDLETHYAMVSPRGRETTEFAEWKKWFAGRTFEIVEWKILSMKIEEIGSEAADRLPESDAVATVAMDVTVRRDGRLEKETDQTDTWVRQGRNWYWTWRGWPSD